MNERQDYLVFEVEEVEEKVDFGGAGCGNCCAAE